MVDNWEIVEYLPEHAKRIVEINLRNHDKWLSEADMKKWCESCSGGPAYTLLVDGIPMACAGIVLQDWNKGEAWSLLSESFYSHKVKIYRAMKAGLDALIAEHKLQRVQSLIDPHYPEAVDFIECFGFEYEGRLRAYGPEKKDYLMYAKVVQ